MLNAKKLTSAGSEKSNTKSPKNKYKNTIISYNNGNKISSHDCHPPKRVKPAAFNQPKRQSIRSNREVAANLPSASPICLPEASPGMIMPKIMEAVCNRIKIKAIIRQNMIAWSVANCLSFSNLPLLYLG